MFNLRLKCIFDALSQSSIHLLPFIWVQVTDTEQRRPDLPLPSQNLRVNALRPSCLLPSILFSQSCVTEDFFLQVFWKNKTKKIPRWWKIQSECLWRPKSFYQSASTTHEAGKTGKTNEHQTALITRCVWTHWSILVLPRTPLNWY